jgi:hypothetical protein
MPAGIDDLEETTMRQILDRSGATEAKTVAPRAQGGWRVGMKTFGTKHFISVVAKDVSASGLLVKVEDPKINAPFQTKTLLELVFYPDGHTLKEEIRMTGVVVRSVPDENNDHRKEMFGVRIVDAPESYERVVEKLLQASA